MNVAAPPLPPFIYPHGKFRARVLLAMVRRHWFIRMRWIITMAGLALLGLERLLRPGFPRPAELIVCVLALAMVNLIWTVVSRSLGRRIEASQNGASDVVRAAVLFANAQMFVDLLLLTAILRFSGGVESPMAIFYLFHVLIAALLLRPFNALLQGAWAILLYGLLGFGECQGWIAPHYRFMASADVIGHHNDWHTVLAGIGVLGAGVLGTLVFTLQISSRLDDQERELSEANQALQKSQSDIQHLQARRSRFMQTAAHQLKSPLTGIEMLAGLIRDNIAQAEKVREIVQRIIRRCHEAIVQVTELLTLERIEQAAPGRHREARTDVQELIERVMNRLGELAESKNITMKAQSQGCRAAYTAVDAFDLENCISNLVENAIKYTPPHGHVWVSAACDEQHVSLRVKDTGMGIAEESLDNIFDPFRRGNEALAANIPGSGLGLTIVREVVEQARGHIEVRSTVGKGSEFILSFPRRLANGVSAGPEGGTTNGAPEVLSQSGDSHRESPSCSIESSQVEDSES